LNERGVDIFWHWQATLPGVRLKSSKFDNSMLLIFF
jgi:hypothetical protein